MSSCGGRRQYEPSFRRTFDYHRRQLAKQDAMDAVLAAVAKKFDKMNAHINRNALVRQQGRRNLFDESLDRPYSIEDFGEAGIELSLKVPGVEKGDLSVELDKKTNHLVISGRRSHKEEGFVSQSQFSHSIQLDNDIEVDEIESMFESGVLTIALPRKQKTVQETRRKIPISFADESGEKTNDEHADTERDDSTADQERSDYVKDDESRNDDASEEVPKRQNKRTDERWDDDFIIFEDDPDEWV